MSVTVSIDTNAVVARIRAASIEALKTVKGQILADCNKFVPYDQGLLRDSSETHSHVMEYFGEAELRLIWATPYARYLYYGLLMVDSKTGSAWAREGDKKVLTSKPLKYSKTAASKLWCEKARAEYGEDWRLIYQNALKERL